MLKKLVFIIFLFLGIFKTFSQPKHEMRAVWFTTNWGLDWPHETVRDYISREQQKGELCRLLDCVEELNFNVVFFQTRLRGDVIYTSKNEPWNAILTGVSGKNPGYDPLEYAVRKCHERGLECHAWIVCIPIGTNKQVKLHGRNSLVARHRDWCINMKGEWYLDPGHPQVAEYLASLAADIVRRYQVDGIHLDYIRYPDQAWAFPDKNTYRKYARKGESLSQWRQNNIDRIVYTIYNAVKQVRHTVKVSAATIGKYRSLPAFPSSGWSCIESVHQDAQKWMKDGKIDFIVPMLYFSERSFYPFLDDWIKNSYGRPVVSGLGAYRLQKTEGNWKLNDFLRQIYDGRYLGASGQAFYRLESLVKNEKGIYDELYHWAYPFPALLPRMPWISDYVPDTPKGFRIESNLSFIDFKWDRTLKAKGYALYGSDIYPVDISQSENLLWTGFINNCRLSYSQIPRCKYYALTAYDEGYNESLPVFIDVSETSPIPPEFKIIYSEKDGTLNFNTQNKYKYIVILDIMGQKIYQGIWRNKINLPNLQSGIYRILYADEKATYKGLFSHIKY
ncbi:family 10 glycosylhydrolase [Coprobacter tertius]|uniref:Family 10 glycosylhydrolase n=1 Tax=Coprobacter tertius TaxID=2944915 RepID=A0ABT1MGF4_9BACT|nr:family 10 glycosylhydrolase [Coprobacter tertius]MCP9611712.1 family 10 glycosylhydrolase [Coprobacter tertius]